MQAALVDIRATQRVVYTADHIRHAHAEQRLIHVPGVVGHRGFDVEQVRELVATLTVLAVRRLGLAYAANVHGDDEISLTRESFVETEFQTVGLLARLV